MRRGDVTALGDLYDRTSSILHGLLLRMVANEAAAQEALVDVYAKAWGRIYTFDPERSSLVAWLILLARNRALEWPGRRVSAVVDAEPGDEPVLLQAFFEGVGGAGLRGALDRLRNSRQGEKGVDAR